MSSKIYPRGETRAAERLLWPRVGTDPSSDSDDDPATRVAVAEQAVERRVQEARQTGFQEGLTAARSELDAGVRQLEERVARTVAELAEMRPRLRRQAESDLVKLSIAIARRVLHRELVADPDALRGLVVAALERLRSQEICRVRAHPSLEPALRAALEHHPQAAAAEFRFDGSLDRGTVVFETAQGNLDASVETQLREIEQGLTDRLRRHS